MSTIWTPVREKLQAADGLLSLSPRVTQPRGMVKVKPYWLSRGLYTATIPGLGDVLNKGKQAIDEATILVPSKHGLAFRQPLNVASSIVDWPRLDMSARTELVFFLCRARRYYGSWFRRGGLESIKGEYSNTEIRYFIHSNTWGSSTCVFEGQSPITLVGTPRVLVTTWSMYENSGYGRAFVDGVGVTRTLGDPHTAMSNTSMLSTYDTGTNQGDDDLFLFAAFNKSLGIDEIKTLSANPWSIFL